MIITTACSSTYTNHSNTNNSLTNSNIGYLNGTRIRDFNNGVSVSL